MIDAITTVWTDILGWISESMGSLQTIFYADNQLTFLGTLAVIGVGIAVVMLVFNYVKDFLRLR